MSQIQTTGSAKFQESQTMLALVQNVWKILKTAIFMFPWRDSELRIAPVYPFYIVKGGEKGLMTRRP